MKSTLFNMVAVLFGITLVASAGVGVVNWITEEPIAQAKLAASNEAVGRVLPPFASVAPADTLTRGEGVAAAKLVIVHKALDAEGGVVGYAIEAPNMTKNGFNGNIRLMVGFTADGKLFNVNVLEQTETPGLGTNMAVEGNPLIESFRRFADRMGEVRFGVKKDGGDIDALTAATISSRAYVDAMECAWETYKYVTGQPAGATQALSGATAASDAASGATASTAAAADGTTDSTGGAAAQEGGENE